jgi:Regulator of chromosome condensation (RCC1) repeat
VDFWVNNYGQLGRDTNDASDLTPMSLGSVSSASAVGVGDFHSGVVLGDSSVLTFEVNADGQLGRTGATSLAPNSTPEVVPGLAGARAIAGSRGHSVVLKHDGTVLTFGDNSGGELGRRTLGTVDLQAGQVPELQGVAAVAANHGNTLALKANGTVWAFGKNSLGQLGRPEDQLPHHEPQQVPGLDHVVAIAAGNAHSVALRSDGTVWSFGNNGSGGLGRATVGINDPVPGMMTGFAGVTAIATGSDRTSAITIDGSVWTVGGSLPPRAVEGIQVLDPPLLTSNRLMDTRVGAGTHDNLFAGIGLRAGGWTTSLAVAGRGGASVLAQAVAVNVTVTEPQADGYVSVFPCGAPPPNASQLNFSAGQTIANLVFAKVGVGQKVCLYTSAPTHLIVDFVDSYSASSGFMSVVPARLADSRGSSTTIDGVGASLGRRPTGSITEVLVSGRGAISSSATSAALNVTAVNPSSSGYLTVFPCGSPLPSTSNVNFEAGRVIANFVLTKVGKDGKVCVRTSADVDLLVDVAGEFSSDELTSFEPLRQADTRSANSTVDGLFANGGLRPVGSEFELQVGGRGGLALSVLQVSLNVTVTGSLDDGYVTVYPCGSRRGSSNLNFAAGQTIANAAITSVGPDGKVCVLTTAPTHLIVDINRSLKGQLP